VTPIRKRLKKSLGVLWAFQISQMMTRRTRRRPSSATGLGIDKRRPESG
jgi:hypothetical protein